VLSHELSTDAEIDISEITAYTYQNHGVAQALQYIDNLEECAARLAAGEGHYKVLSDIHPQLRVKHCQHHYIFGVMKNPRPMLVVAILHERMELIRRLKEYLQ